ncbi:MAG: hypothetical protein U1E76_15645 [Planctomycetota bacterium]
MQLFASCAPGLESLLCDELTRLGMQDVTPGFAGAFFTGLHADLYRANLWLRTASRVQRIVFAGPAASGEQLVEAVRAIAWERWLGAERGIAIELHDARRSREASAQLVARLAHAIAARLSPGARHHPAGMRIVIHVHRGMATIGLDCSGKALHKRGYHATSTHAAPLKETLAAALLLTARYDGSEPLWDPMCGSGTIAIEAALIAVHKAPLIHRHKGEFACEWHRDFDYRTWRAVGDAARRERRVRPAFAIVGSDADAASVCAAAAAAQRARVRHHLRLYAARFATARAPAPAGLLIANLPYGARLGTPHELRELYRLVGARIRGELGAWRFALLVPDGALADELGIAAASSVPLNNGALDCRLLMSGPR